MKELPIIQFLRNWYKSEKDTHRKRCIHAAAEILQERFPSAASAQNAAAEFRKITKEKSKEWGDAVMNAEMSRGRVAARKPVVEVLFFVFVEAQLTVLEQHAAYRVPTDLEPCSPGDVFLRKGNVVVLRHHLNVLYWQSSGGATNVQP